jgi:hypothetical protein
MDVLPDEMVGEILSHVYLPSLMDCVCVSKEMSIMSMIDIVEIKSRERLIQECIKGNHLSLIRCPLFKLMPRIGIKVTAKNGHSTLCKLLLRINPEWGKWKLGLIAASEGGHLDLIRFLLDEYLYRYDLFQSEPMYEDCNDSEYENVLSDALHGACHYGQYHAIILLLEYQPYVSGLTLNHACASGSQEVVNLILGKIYDLSISDCNRGLLGSCEGKNWTIAQQMITLGASDWRGALISACAYGWMEMVLFLSEKENIFWNEGLVTACRYGHYDLSKLILESFIKNISDRRHVFQSACLSGDLRIIRLILDNGPIDQYTFFKGAMNSLLHGSVEVIDYIWDKYAQSRGLLVNTSDTWTRALILYVRSDSDNPDVIKFFLNKGAQITEDCIIRALHVAPYEMLYLLLENCRHPLTEEILNYGLATSCNLEKYDIAHLLIERGATSCPCGKPVSEH